MKRTFEEMMDAPVLRWQRHCNFGITEAIGLAIAAAAADVGVGATTAGIIGTVGAGAIEGAGLGAAGSAITGGDPGKGALGGAIGGGVLSGFGPVLGSELGSATAGDVLAGAAGGTLGAAATGQNLAGGALGGAVSGGVSAALSGNLTPGPTSGSAPTPGGTSSAAAVAAPSSVAAASPDATGQFNATNWENTSVEGLGSTGPQPGLTGATAPITPVQTGSLPDLTPGAGATSGAGAGTPPATVGGLQSVTPDASATAPGSGSVSGTNTPGAVGAGAASGAQTNATGINPNSIPGGATAPTGTVGAPKLDVNLGTLNAAAPTVPAAGTSVDRFLENPSLSSGWDVIKNNPLQSIAGGALAYDLIKGNQSLPGQDQINATAQRSLAQGNQLQGYLSSGQLPPGLQQQVNASELAAEASIRQQYANRGMSGSSAEMQDIHSAKVQAAGQSADLAIQLFQQGTSETQLGSQLYGQLMGVAMQQDQALSSGITNFVSALAGLNRPIVINPGTGVTG